MRLVILALLPALWLGALVPPVQAQTCAGVHQTVSPALTDFSGGTYHRMDGTPTGYAGGLYPGGSNVRPPAHTAAGMAAAHRGVPLDSDGLPDLAGGKIGMISVGMSNTFSEFRDFRLLALADPALNPKLVLVNGAAASMTAEYWANSDTNVYSLTWPLLDTRLANAGLTPAQVQVAWVKLTRTGSGAFPDKPLQLQTDLGAVARNLLIRFPNIKLAYFSSRTRSYNYDIGLSPEPAAFETGFAVKWLLEQQMLGDPMLNYDAARGSVMVPWMSWGAYLWIDGLNPRSDGYVWPQTDLVGDCTHPSASGNAKVAEMLLRFFKTDATARCWFLTGCWSVYLPHVTAPAPASASSWEPVLYE